MVRVTTQNRGNELGDIFRVVRSVRIHEDRDLGVDVPACIADRQALASARVRQDPRTRFRG